MDFQLAQQELKQIKEVIQIDDLLKNSVTYENKDAINERINILNSMFPKVTNLLNLGHISRTERDELNSKIEAALDQCKNAVILFCQNQGMFYETKRW